MTCDVFYRGNFGFELDIQILVPVNLKTLLTIKWSHLHRLVKLQASSMNRPSNGQPTTDPFFERMMDERIATLRAFLRMTTEKYQCPEPPTVTTDETTGADERIPTDSNVIELRRKR